MGKKTAIVIGLTMALVPLACRKRPASIAERQALAEDAMLLCEAAEAGDSRQVQALLSAGVEADVPRKDGHVALHCATSRGHENVAGLLLRNGADINATTTSGATPLECATRRRCANIVELLREHGAITRGVKRDKAGP